jgi:hypothetical protein
MDIQPKSQIWEICFGIGSLIFIIFVGAIFLSKFWFWVSFEMVSAFFVAFGCGGEWWLHHHPAGRKKNEKDGYHRVEARFIALVAVGVIMEPFGLGHSLVEGVQLQKDVETEKVLVKAIGTTNAQLVASNLESEKELLELQAAVQWRKITTTQEEGIIKLLKPFIVSNALETNKIDIGAQGSDPEAAAYAARISDILVKCGCKVDFRTPWVFVPLTPDFRPRSPIGMEFDVKSTSDPLAVGIWKAFEAANVKPETVTTDEPVFSGQFGIFVGHKPEK